VFIVANFLFATASVLQLVLTVYLWIVIARAIISWVNPDPYNPIVRFLFNATEPLLFWIRRRLPVFFGGIDFSPLLVLVAIYFLQGFLVQSLRDLAVSVR
jgi:YggT family protein